MHREEKEDAGADTITNGFNLDLVPLLAANEVVLVKLDLRDPAGEIISENFYWLAAKTASYRRFNGLPVVFLSLTAKSFASKNIRVQVELQNTGNVVSLANKLTR